MRFGGLFWKLFAVLWIGMLLSFLAGATYLELTGQNAGRREMEVRLRGGIQLADAAALIETGGSEALLRVLPRWNARPDTPPLSLAPAPPGGTERTVVDPNGNVVVVSVSTPVVETGAPRPSLISIPVLFGALISLIGGWLSAWYLARPLRHLSRALRSMAGGRLDTRVTPLIGKRRDEIADLAKDFDGMADQLQRLVENRQRLLHDLSHELRSPLTRLQAAISLFRRNPADATVTLERVEREAGRIDDMVGELLTLARLEAGGGEVPGEKVDLIEILAAITDDAAFEAETSGRTLNFHAEGGFVREVRGEVLYRAFENVIRNAVKYTAPGTAVEVEARVEASSGDLVVTVSDHGPGVPSEMLEKIFDPFTRVEASGPGGYGLGLAITKRAIESHGGRVRAEAGPNGGLTVRLAVPAG